MVQKQGWNVAEIKTVAGMSVDDYCRVFKSQKGQEVRKVIEFCLQFGRSDDGAMQEISKRAKEALSRIGQESALNALRARRYGL
jgi:hypothetical protein